MKIPALLFTTFSFVCAASAQISISVTGSYDQNFDTLPSSGSPVWTDNTTLAGWYADSVSEIVASAGSSASPDLYSFGSSSSSERALGSITNESSGAIAFGVLFHNTSASDITFTNLSYRGELWRMGSPAAAEKLDFAYQISTSAITNTLTGTWTDINALDFINPNPSATGGTGGLDGNLAGNVVNLNSPLSISLAANSYLMFRWYDAELSGADNGLGIDDLSISYTGASAIITAVPEPSTYGLVGAAMLVGTIIWRRRQRSTVGR